MKLVCIKTYCLALAPLATLARCISYNILIYVCIVSVTCGKRETLRTFVSETRSYLIDRNQLSESIEC